MHRAQQGKTNFKIINHSQLAAHTVVVGLSGEEGLISEILEIIEN